MQEDKKKTLIQYAVVGVVIITLYLTGLHTEVIGFVQRGLLATGLMNPKVEVTTPGQAEIKETTAILPAADFNLQLKDKNGFIISLADLKGKVIFLNFWATWCPPCIAEMPGINNIHDE